MSATDNSASYQRRSRSRSRSKSRSRRDIFCDKGIYFKGFPLNWDKSRTREYFEKFGAISRVVLLDQHPGAGIITFTESYSAQQCMEKTKRLNWRGYDTQEAVSINYAKQKRNDARYHPLKRSTSKSRYRSRSRSASRSKYRSRDRSISRTRYKSRSRSPFRQNTTYKFDYNGYESQKENRSKIINNNDNRDKLLDSKSYDTKDRMDDNNNNDDKSMDVKREKISVNDWNQYGVIFWLNRINNGKFGDAKYNDLRNCIVNAGLKGSELVTLNGIALRFGGVVDEKDQKQILNAISDLVINDNFDNMAEDLGITDEQKVYCDPTTFEIMSDPVMITVSGYTYQRDNIERYIAKYHKDPMTGQEIELSHIVSNQALKNMIQQWKQKRLSWI